MQLNSTQKSEIFQDGYTHLRGAISPLLAHEALRAINGSLGDNGMPPDDLPKMRSQSYCRELTTTAVITDLFNASPLRALCESAFGEGHVLPVERGQIALRFPSLRAKNYALRPHLDGIAVPNNGVTPGVYANFTALVGVFLSDMPETEMGNFTVWPGTHHLYEKHFQTHGVETFLEGTPKIDLPTHRPIRARAGDAVFCHYQLGHSIVPNFSPHIRYAVFFRVLHRDHGNHRREVLADIWRDWPGLESEIAAAQSTQIEHA